MARWPATVVDTAAMATSKYVGWEEVYICREKGKREIHYTMKRRDGGKDLAVIAKERSLRHMTYRFLLDFNSHEFTKPRSRRELLDWLNSFLPGEDLRSSDSPQASGGSSDVNGTGDLDVEAMQDTQLQKVGFITKEFLWVGSSWTCKKKRKHYKAFSRNGFKISVNEFVHVLAEENCRLVAYLDDMYEDSEGNKMVVVRWFHKIDEVGLDLPHDFNDREIFFSLCLQDLSIECIDGLAMVLSPQHYEKFLSVAKHTKLEPYMCNRQYDNDELTPFDITQIKGYWKQDVLRYMFSLSSSRPLDKTGPPEDSGKREVNCDGAGSKPRKRLRLSRDHKLDMTCSHENDDAMEIDKSNIVGQSNHGLTQGPRVTVSRVGIKVVAPRQATAIGSGVEVLSQDSGMRGCWFKATIIKKHKNKVKLSYLDIKDAENEANCLEEWVMRSRIAVRDDMGLRLHGRTTIRPSFPSQRGKISWAFNVGAVVDAWQHDGWWEGIVIQTHPNETFRVYFPGEKREAVFGRSDLRHSQEWMGNTWRELSEKPDVAASILSGLVKCDSKQADCDVRKEDCSIQENNKIVPDLLKDDFLSQLKWKTVGKRKRTRFSVQKLHPRNIRVNSERTVFHSTLKFGKETSKVDRDYRKFGKENSETSKVDRDNWKFGKENSETSKVDHDNRKYTSVPLFSPPVIPPPLTSLVMSR